MNPLFSDQECSQTDLFRHFLSKSQDVFETTRVQQPPLVEIVSDPNDAVQQLQDPKSAVVAGGEIKAEIIRSKIHIDVKMRVSISLGTLMTVSSIIGSSIYQGEFVNFPF